MKSAAPGTLPSFRPEGMAAAQTAAGGPACAASWLVRPPPTPPSHPQTAAFVSPTVPAYDGDFAAAGAAAAADGGDGGCWCGALRRPAFVTGACSASVRRRA